MTGYSSGLLMYTCLPLDTGLGGVSTTDWSEGWEGLWEDRKNRLEVLVDKIGLLLRNRSTLLNSI